VRRFLVVVLLLLTLLGVSLAAREMLLPARPAAETFVEVVPGMGSRAIASSLAGHGIIRSRYAFDLWHVLRGGTLKAGEYRFDQPATLAAVYNRLVRGDVYTRTVTIPEGFNLFDIAQAVQDAQLGSRESFLAAANQNVALIADIDPGAKNLEGYLFPDTYRFQRHQPPSQLLAAMVRRFRQGSASIGLEGGGYHRIVTLASLVEKETPVAEDRPLVASVLENRLAQDMPLMTDPTVIYAALLEKQYRGAIYQSDLKRDSAYNTYRHSGLPPGPICSPGIASLQAAMHPAASKFLYFVADAGASGHSRFATTLEEHERNVSAYRRGLKEAQGTH
jgi:UPF0755 protein